MYTCSGLPLLAESVILILGLVFDILHTVYGYSKINSYYDILSIIQYIQVTCRNVSLSHCNGHHCKAECKSTFMQHLS